MMRLGPIALALTLLADPTMADETLAESVGRRVRLDSPERLQGRLVRFDADTVTIAPEAGPDRTFARAALGHLEVRRGKAWHVAYISIGAAAGFGTSGLFLGVSTCPPDCTPEDDARTRRKFLLGAGAAAVAGGLILGLATRNIWEDVDTRALQVGVVPKRGGAAVWGSIRF